MNAGSSLTRSPSASHSANTRSRLTRPYVFWQRSQVLTSLRHAAAMAESLNPYGVLARGYAMVEKDGAVSEVAALRPGDAITLRGAAVRADCVVQSVHKNAQGGMTL